MIDGSDAQVFTPVYHRAAKQYECSSCDKTIERGHIFCRIAGNCDGDFWRSRFCADCDHDRRWLQKRGHSWMVGIITTDYDQCRLELNA